MAEQAIYAQLSAIPALGNRIYSLTAPQNTATPYVTLQRISATRYSAFGDDVEPVEATIQVDLYALHSAGWTAFDATAQAVRAALQRVSNTDIIDAFIDAERDDYEEDTELYRKSFDVRTWYRET